MGATTRPLFPRAPRATDCFDRPGAAFVDGAFVFAAARGLPLAPFRVLFAGAEGAAADAAFRFVGVEGDATGAALRPRFEGVAGAVAAGFRPLFAAPVALVTAFEGAFAETRSTAVSTVATVRADAVAPPRPVPRPPRRPCSTPRCSSLTRSLICSNMQRT